MDIRFPFGRADIFFASCKKYKKTVDKYPQGVYNIYAAKDTHKGICIARRQKNLDNRNDKELSCGCCDTCRHKHTPRDDKEIKQLKNRLSRVSGQINGIIKMLDDNRYCGDILIQVAAVESAMQSFGYLILQEH